MRIKLQKRKQFELINSAKADGTWMNLAGKLGLATNYLANELRKEQRLISEEVYNKLCRIAGENFDKFIVKRIYDNWGRSKGGKISDGGIKKFVYPKGDGNLAELIGIILGDGHLEYKIRTKNSRAYSLTITGHSIDDYDYLSSYVPILIKKTLHEEPKVKIVPKRNVVYLRLYGKEMITFFKKKGLNPGNKKLNNQGIPNWILKDKRLLVHCIRGLVDTDGSIHYISKNNKNLRICFTSYISNLLNGVRESLIGFGFNPSKIIKGNQIFLSSKKDVDLYMKKIGFSNHKHLNRFQNLRKNAPVVQRLKIPPSRLPRITSSR